MKLRITFNGVPNVDDEIVFKYDSNYPSLPSTAFNQYSIFKTVRVNYGEVTLGTDGATQALNYYNAFLIDYGVNHNVTRVDNVVEIEPLNGSTLFDSFCDSSLVVFGFNNNAIHEIIFTPRQYAYPTIMNRDYLITEDDYLVITEDNKKIRL